MYISILIRTIKYILRADLIITMQLAFVCVMDQPQSA